MNSYRRAFGAVVTTALIGSGLVLGTAQAAPPRPAAEQRILLDLLEVVTGPLLGGTGVLGSPLSITDPVWSLPGVSTSYQWMRNGIPIVGATGSSYTPVSADAGSEITALVTGSLLGVLPVSVLTNAIGIPLPGDPGPDPVALVATVLPLLSGVPVVGNVLTLVPAEWNLPGVTTTVQWLSNGVPIPGATGTSLPLGPELAGTEITALVTGVVAGLPLVSLITGSLGIVPAAPDAITATSVPGVSGSGKVGTLLVGSDPIWSTDGVTTTYQWLRNSVPIPGATQKSYTVTADDVAKQLSLRATGKKGEATGTAASASVLGKLGDLLAETAPSISGVARAGNVLTVQPGAWGLGTLPTFGYQWYLDNQPITGATNSQYVVKVTDAGRKLAVLVNVTRLGFTPASAAAGPVTVAKVASKTTLKLLKKKIKQGKAGLLRITLAPGSLRPSGKVKIFDGRKLLKTYTVRLADNGTRIVKLPKLKPGKHKLTARFAGTRATTASKSAPVVLTVIRKR